MDIREKVISMETSDTHLTVHRNPFHSDRVTIYLIISGEPVSQNDTDFAETQLLKAYLKEYFLTQNALYLSLSAKENDGETVFQRFEEQYNTAIRDNQLRYTSSFVVVPVFVQGEQFPESLWQNFHQWFSKMLVYISHHAINDIWLPAVLFSGRDYFKNDAFIQKILSNEQLLKRSLPLLILYPQNSHGFIPLENRLKTIAVLSLLLPCQTNSVFGKTGDPDIQCYAARLMTIRKPKNMEKLLRAKSLLEFFEKDPEDADKQLKQLGEKLSELLYEVWDRLESLPCKRDNGGNHLAYDSKTISLAPFYSILFDKNAGSDQKQKKLRFFAQKYYLRYLPLYTPLLNDIDCRSFFRKYQDSYGNYLTGLSYLFDESLQQSLLNRIAPLQLSQNHILPQDHEITIYLTDLSKEMTNRSTAFYQKMFTNASWFLKAKERFSGLQSCLTTLKESLDERIRFYSGLEGSVDTSGIQWGDKHRKELMDVWLDLLFSEKAEEDFVDIFCQKLFEIAGFSQESITEYLRHFDHHIDNGKVLKSWQKLLDVDTAGIAPASGVVEENYVMCSSALTGKEVLEKIHPVSELIDTKEMQDRIEFVFLDRAGKWISTQEGNK